MADAAPTECDPQAQPAPDYEFDQRIAWWLPPGRLVAAKTRQAAPPSLLACHGAVIGLRFRAFLRGSPHEIPN
jgi:murein endopeptidase